MSLNLGFTGQEEEVPTQGNYVHCQRSASSRRHYFSYFLAFIEMVTCNKIHLYEVYLIYFDNYTQLYNHYHNQNRKVFLWPYTAIAFEAKTRLICTWVVRKDFIGEIEAGAGMRIKFRWGREEKAPNWRIANLRSNYYTIWREWRGQASQCWEVRLESQIHVTLQKVFNVRLRSWNLNYMQLELIVLSLKQSSQRI